MLKVTVLAKDQFRVVGMTSGKDCPTLIFLESGSAETKASRVGLAQMLEFVARHGLAEMPSSWSHEVDKQSGILEFVKGRLRLLYFKGANGDIAVCTVGLVKKTQKVDRSAVAAAKKMKLSYEAAAGNVLYDEGEEDDVE